MTRLYLLSSDTRTMVSVRGVVGHLLGIAVLAEHQIVLDLCVRFAECRSAHQRKKQSKQDGRKMLFHMFLRRGRFLILFI